MSSFFDQLSCVDQQLMDLQRYGVDGHESCCSNVATIATPAAKTLMVSGPLEFEQTWLF